jgi:hypothetical protein
MRSFTFLKNETESISTKMTLKNSQKLLMGFLALILVAGMSTPAFAAVGDTVRVVDADGFIDSGDVFCSVGLSFDGSSLYWDACGTGTIWITDTNAVPNVIDSRNFAAEIPEFPNAMAFDAARGVTYVAAQNNDGQGCPIYEIDHKGTFNNLQDDTVSKLFTAVSGNVGGCFVDGLAYSQNDPLAGTDALYISGDAQPTTGLYTLAGVFVQSIDMSSIDVGMTTTSGLAVGGSNLYSANNGGGDVFRATLPGLVLLDQFTSGDERQEDLECDPTSFDVEVMWVRTTPQGGSFANVATAYEIEANTCGLGGGGGGNQPIGGTVGSMSTTSLLVAGAQANMGLWSLALVGIVGAAAAITYKVKSKSEQ